MISFNDFKIFFFIIVIAFLIMLEAISLGICLVVAIMTKLTYRFGMACLNAAEKIGNKIAEIRDQKK